MTSTFRTLSLEMADIECSGFEPQNWRKDRCKRCFQLEEQHKVNAETFEQEAVGRKRLKSRHKRKDGSRSDADSATSSCSMQEIDNDNALTLAERNTKLIALTEEVSMDGNSDKTEQISAEKSVHSESPTSHSPPGSSASISLGSLARLKSPGGHSIRSVSSEYASAHSTAGDRDDRSLSRATSYESVASTVHGDEPFNVAAIGFDADGDAGRRTPTVEECSCDAAAIRLKLETIERKCAELERENDKLRQENDGVEELKSQLAVFEQTCREQKMLISQLESCSEEQERSAKDFSTSASDHQAEVQHLREQLTAAEQLCEEVMDENENLKNELRGLQQELDEVRDQYREEEIDEFRDLQRELEQTAKNCRILQFKLRKAERRNDQTEADRQHLQDKIKEILSNNGSNVDASVVDSPRLHELESELRIAKEVSVRLHNELEAMEEKRCKLEDDNFCLRERIREVEAREKIIDMIKNKSDQNSKKPGNDPVAAQRNHEQQLLRNLHDALERETDLKDQLRFSEHDVKIAYRKISDLETENECLMRQLAKQSSVHSSPQRELSSNSQSIKGSRPPMKRSLSEGHAHIELQLAEHEVHVLRAKLEKVQRDNECMVSKISLLEREASRCGGKTNFSDDEIRGVVPDTYYKQKIRILEEELEEWKIKFDTMQKAEADQDHLDASRKMAQKAALSVHRTHADLSTEISAPHAFYALQKDAELKIKAEREVASLRQKVANLSAENEKLHSENKRVSLRRISRKNDLNKTIVTATDFNPNELDLNEKVEKMEMDIHKFITRITELEKDNEQLKKELDRRKRLDQIKRETSTENCEGSLENIDQLPENSEHKDAINLSRDNTLLKQNLKTEKTRVINLEKQLAEYKQLIFMSENNRLVTMASRVEVLSIQLKEMQARYDVVHKKLLSSNCNGKSNKYEDLLKEQIETLEIALAEEKAKNKVSRETSVNSNQDDSSAKACDYNQILVNVETQVERIFSRVETLELEQQTNNGTKECSRKMPSVEEDQEKLLSDINSVKSELDSLRSKLRERACNNVPNSNISEIGWSANDQAQNTSALQQKLRQQERLIKDLKDQYDSCRLEKCDTLRECEKATVRLLQTEERWNKELEKLKESYENQVKDLKYYLQEAERVRDEKSAALADKSSVLSEKTKRLNECESRLLKLENELKSRHKDLQEKLDIEKRRAKDFETKYQKLEELYDNEKAKSSSDKERLKQELSEIKKRNDEARSDFEKLKSGYERKEQIWINERQSFETKIAEMKQEINEVEIKAAKRAQELSSLEHQNLIAALNEQKREAEDQIRLWEEEKADLLRQIENKNRDLEKYNDSLARSVRETDQLKSKIAEQKVQLEEARRLRDEIKEEMSRWQQTWAKERAELAHKMRQEEKVQQAEQQAMQLKYESRVKVMEDSNRRTQNQLTQIRRERDQFRENIAALEKKLLDASQRLEVEEKEWNRKLAVNAAKAEEADNLRVALEAEKRERETLEKNYCADKTLWLVQKEQLSDQLNKISGGNEKFNGVLNATDKDKLIAQSVELANQLRHQADETKKTHQDEMNKLKAEMVRMKADWAKERSSLTRKNKECKENLKIQEIDRLNMLSHRDQNESDKNRLQIERDALAAKLQDCEIHQLANKYKLDKIADNLTNLNNRLSENALDRTELDNTLKKMLDQLFFVREDMSKTKELGKINNNQQPRFEIIQDKKTFLFGLEADCISTKSAPPFDKDGAGFPVADSDTQTVVDSHVRPAASLSSSSILSEKPPMLNSKSISMCSDSGAEQSWFTKQRLRSQSPNPKKITNYPNPPPSIIFNKILGVEYDSAGRRHWTRKSFFQRSVSLDPAGGINLVDKYTSEPATKCDDKTDLTVRQTALKSSLAVATSTTNLSLGSHSPSYRRRMVDIFATLRKSTSRERRKAAFNDQKPGSVDEHDQSAEGSTDERSRSRFPSGRKLFDKIRGRSGSRGPKKSGVQSRDASLETTAKQVHSNKPETSSSGTTTETDNEREERNKLRSVPVTVRCEEPLVSAPAPSPDVPAASASQKISTPDAPPKRASQAQNKPVKCSGISTKFRANVPLSSSVNTKSTKPAFKPVTSSYGSVRMLSAKFLNR